MSVKIGFSCELTVDAYERKKIIESLLKKETEPTSKRKILLEEELTNLQLHIDMYEMHLKEKKEREDAEKSRLKEREDAEKSRLQKIKKEQNIAFSLILLVICSVWFIGFFTQYINAKQQLDEASKPFISKKIKKLK